MDPMFYQGRVKRAAANQTEGLDLFEQPPDVVPSASEPEGADRPMTPEERNQRDIDRLVPLARELAQKAGRHGVTVADLRTHAVNRGLLTGEEQGRRLSFLGSLMKAAALHPTPSFRRSHIDRSNGNLQRIWVAPEYEHG